MARPIDADELKNQIKHMPRTVNPDLVQYKLVQAIIADIPTLTPPNEWVSVENALPTEHEPVLCIVSGKPKANITLEEAYQLGSWNKADGWIIDEYLDWEDADVSWWMSLPAPPDKDNNVLAKTPNEALTLEKLRASPHGKIKDSTLQSICNRANEIACRPPEGEEDA